jgi:hypothetical protein
MVSQRDSDSFKQSNLFGALLLHTYGRNKELKDSPPFVRLGEIGLSPSQLFTLPKGCGSCAAIRLM